MNSTTQPCAICGNTKQNKQFTAKEMMFGTKEEFDYLECGACGCLQLITLPESFGQYYPPDYYSFNPKPDTLRERIYSRIRKEIVLYRMGLGILGKLFIVIPLMKGYLTWIKLVKQINFKLNILDVGCGSGKLLRELKSFGFTKLTGVDPFIKEDLEKEPGFKILKQSLEDTEGTFDLIMLHHSFEHMSNPKDVFISIRKKLAPDGKAIIRIPVADSYAYKTYGIDWAELDAPRHLYLHTKKSIELLANQAGLRVRSVLYDSGRFEIVGSEKIKRGIPLMDKTKIFSLFKLWEFDFKVEKLNKNGTASRACFYLEAV